MRLTIAIPTSFLNATLKATQAPAMERSAQLLILDNHSDVPVEETLRDPLGELPQA